MCDSQHKSRKETPPKPSHENHKKGSENHQKEKMGEASRTLKSPKIFD
jgi:hypothetical protein